MSYPEAAALYRKFGYDEVLPYDRFATQLLARPARAAAENEPTRKGAFTVDGRADFHGKIIYKECKSGVFPPSGWDGPAVAARSSDLPDARLVLDFVYGYAGEGPSLPQGSSAPTCETHE